MGCGHAATSSQRNPGRTFEISGPFRTSGSSPTITRSASGYKHKGNLYADLSWTGATTASVEVLRDGDLVATTDNDGAHTDAIPGRGHGTFTYQLREAGGTGASNEVTVSTKG